MSTPCSRNVSLCTQRDTPMFACAKTPIDPIRERFSIGIGIDGGWCELAADTQQRFVERALRRKKLFLAMSIVGIVIAVVLAAYYGFRWLNDPTYSIGPRAVIILLILLNSRQNLRQYRFASFIEGCKKKGVSGRGAGLGA